MMQHVTNFSFTCNSSLTRFVNEVITDFISSIHFFDNKSVININIDDQDILRHRSSNRKLK